MAILNDYFAWCAQLLPSSLGQLHYIILEAQPQCVARVARATQRERKSINKADLKVKY